MSYSTKISLKCGELYYRDVIVNSLWNASNRNFQTTPFNFLKKIQGKSDLQTYYSNWL